MKNIIKSIAITSIILLSACAENNFTSEACRTSNGLEGVWVRNVPMLVINGGSNMDDTKMRACFEALLFERNNHPAN